MAYSTPSTRSTGYVVLAADWNEFVNNFKAMAPDAFTADGDIYIASAANTGVKLAAFTSSTGTLKHEHGGLEADVSSGDGFVEIKGGSTTVVKTKTNATAAPTVNDDTDEGYAIGSVWIDVTHDKAYICLDITDGAAVWIETTQVAGLTLSGATANALVTITGANALTEETELTYNGAGLLELQRSHVGELTAKVRNTSSSASAVSRVAIDAEDGGGDSRVDFEILNGGSTWSSGVDNGESDQWVLAASGALGTNDAIRVVHATQEISFDAPATYTTFDYVCIKCQAHSAQDLGECPSCGGVMEWHDDVLAVRALSQPALRREALDHLDRLGVITLSSHTDGDLWVGLNVQTSILFTWSALWQNRQRIEALEDRIRALEGHIGRSN